MAIHQLVGEVDARHAGHDDVGDEDVERAAELARAAMRLGAVADRDDVVAGPLEEPGGHVADGRLVLDDQDRADADRARSPDRGFVDVDRGVDAREVELERGAVPGLGVEPDVAAGLVDDPVDRGQPEAGALALLLGREERLEDVLARVAVHADARCR